MLLLASLVKLHRSPNLSLPWLSSIMLCGAEDCFVCPVNSDPRKWGLEAIARLDARWAHTKQF